MISINLFQGLVTTQKICNACHQKKDAQRDFYARGDGRRTTCKSCDDARKKKNDTDERRQRRNALVSKNYRESEEVRRKKLERDRQWREQHPNLRSYMNDAARRHYRRHREQKQEQGRQKYRSNPERGRRQALLRVYKKYGISEIDFEKLLQQQAGVCALCLQPERRNVRGRVTRLAVDHCHQTGRVRGLLCSHCNSKLTMFEELVRLFGFDNAVERIRKYLGL